MEAVTLVRCPRCNSPDMPPYKFGEALVGVIYAEIYRGARKCMDCDNVFTPQYHHAAVRWAHVQKDRR